MVTHDTRFARHADRTRLAALLGRLGVDVVDADPDNREAAELLRRRFVVHL